MIQVKKGLWRLCSDKVNDQISSIEQAMQNAQAAANDETKSSAGDKYETGRAMMHLEKEKLATQLAEALKMRRALDQIEADKPELEVKLGTVVKTPMAQYFLSVSVGQVKYEGATYFAISPAAPIGRQMLGKKAGDRFSFGGKQVEILEVF